MTNSRLERRVIRFGVFEANLFAGELRKRGRKVRLQDQPFQVLALLLRHPGEIVTREELQQTLWPADTFVEFDHGVNTAIKKVRKALGDSAVNPRYVETIPKRGYRFIAPISTAGEEAGEGPERAVAAPRWLWVAGLLAVVVIAGLIGWFAAGGRRAPEPELAAVPLTTDPGAEAMPSLSPDGSQVAYISCPSYGDCDIYVKQIGIERPVRLTTHPAPDISPAWSPDGRFIAFLRVPYEDSTVLQYVLIPQRGGPERVLLQVEILSANPLPIPGPYLCWTPDGKWILGPTIAEGTQRLALMLVSVESGEVRPLASPPAGVWGDSAPAISPDGSKLAFARYQEFDRSDIYVLDLAQDYSTVGEARKIPRQNRFNRAPAWTPDGHEIVFVSGDATNSGLWRIPVSGTGEAQRMALPGDAVSGLSISARGRRLVYDSIYVDVNIWRLEIGPLSSEPSAKVIFSTRADFGPVFSPDGERIAFVSDRSGNEEIWACDRDGSNPRQVTALASSNAARPRWSPDGKQIVFYSVRDRQEEIYVVKADGGAPRRLTDHPSNDHHPSWSSDGLWIYFCSDRTGRQEVWKMAASGGEARQVTAIGGDGPQESPDGRFLYYDRGWPSQFTLYRMPVNGGEETVVAEGVHPLACWTIGANGVYWFTTPEEGPRTELRMRRFDTWETDTLAVVNKPVNWGVTVSPDGRTLLYSQVDTGNSDLMLVENFR